MLDDIKKYASNRKIVTIHDHWDLSFDEPLENQIEKLHEDLIQITFIRGYLLDIGWYPEHNENGKFKGVLIRYEQWDSPVYEIETRDMGNIIDWLQEVIECVFDFDLKSN